MALSLCSCSLLQPGEVEPTPEIVGFQTGAATAVQQASQDDPGGQATQEPAPTPAADPPSEQLSVEDGQSPAPTDEPEQPTPTPEPDTEPSAQPSTGVEPAQQSATAETAAQEPDTRETPADSVPPVSPEGPVAALILPNGGAFADFAGTFVSAAKPVLEGQGFTVLEYYSDDGNSEANNIYSAIGSGAVCIAIMPSYTDNTGDALNECHLQGIPVVSLMSPSAGNIALVSPDYSEMGGLFADAVHTALPDGSSTLLVANGSLPFINQMIRDGFTQKAEGYENISLRSSLLLNTGSNDVYDKATVALGDENISSVIVIDESASAEVARAVEDSGREIVLLTTGGNSTVSGMVGDGQVYASVFASPYQLAEMACSAIAAAIADPAGAASYAKLKSEMIAAETADSYTSNTGYADILSPLDAVPSDAGAEASADAETTGQEEDE